MTSASPIPNAPTRFTAPFSAAVGGPYTLASNTLAGCSWVGFPTGPTFHPGNGRILYHLTGGARSCPRASNSELKLTERTVIPFDQWSPPSTGKYRAVFHFLLNGSLTARCVYGSPTHAIATVQFDWNFFPVIYSGNVYNGVWGAGVGNYTFLSKVSATSSVAWNQSITAFLNGSFQSGRTYTLALTAYTWGDFEAFGHSGNLATFDVDLGSHGRHVTLKSAIIR